MWEYNTGYLTLLPVAQWSRQARRRQRRHFACRETESEIKHFHDVLERRGGRGGGGVEMTFIWRSSVSNSNYEWPLTHWQNCWGCVKDNWFCGRIYIHDGFYRQEYWTATEINLFISFILQYTASMLWAKAQHAPPLQKMSAWKHNGCANSEIRYSVTNQN